MPMVLGYDFRQVAADVLAIVTIAAMLIGIHVFVPPGVRAELALEYPTPNPVDALTAAYVHVNDAHLTGNVLGYLAGAGVAYLLSLAARERRWFHLSWLTFLTVLPVAVGLTAAVIIDRPVVGRGFSGVVAGFAGLLLVAGGVVLYRVFDVDRRSMWEVVAVLAVVVAVEILWLATEARPVLVVGILVVGVGLPLGSLAWRGIRSGIWTDGDNLGRLAGAVVATGLVLGIVTWFVVGLFPAQIVANGGVTNILGHYLGLVYGVLVAAWGYRYWSAGPENRRS